MDRPLQATRLAVSTECPLFGPERLYRQVARAVALGYSDHANLLGKPGKHPARAGDQTTKRACRRLNEVRWLMFACIASINSVIERGEHSLVVGILFGPTKRLDALDEDFAVRGTGALQDLHHFGNIVS